METGQIVIERSSPDEDGIIYAQVVVSNGRFSGAVEDYLGADELHAFALYLQWFPRSLADSAAFGCDAQAIGWRDRLCIRAYVVDRGGHVGLEYKLRSGGNRSLSAISEFTVVTEASSVNSFGRMLAGWVRSKTQRLEYTFQSST